VAQNNNGKAVFEKDMPDCPKCGKKLRRIKGETPVMSPKLL
jgi:ssDNA-binding Zn-finger/Zn-ribbon topoisomerase 1